MRQFNNGESYFDNDGNLLHGRVIFYKKRTTIKENIYNSAGNVIPNPIFTNNIGQLSDQVFLGDVDYTIYFEKYIGSGDMTSDTSDEYYVFQYSTENLYNTFNIDIDTKGYQVVDTIADLRLTDPAIIESESGNKELILAGYNTYGDKPSVHYVWDPSSTESDNGGSVIKVSNIGTGRWKIVNSFISGLDVRHFGCFPAENSESTSITQTYAAQHAYNYTSKIGVPIYFPATSSAYYSHYRIDNATIKNAIFADNVIIHVGDGATTNIYLSNISSYLNVGFAEGLNGNCNVHGEILETKSASNNKTKLFPTEKLIINSNTYGPATYSNIEVYVEGEFSNTGTIEFEYCTFSDNKNISNNNNSLFFYNCKLSGLEFSDDCEIDRFGFADCTSEVDLWPSASKYLLFCYLNNSSVIDLKNKTAEVLYEDGYYFVNPVSFYNVNAANAIIHVNNNTHIENCSLAVSMYNADDKNITIKNSNISFITEGLNKMGTIDINNSILIVSSLVNAAYIKANDSTITKDPSVTSSLTADTAEITNTNISLVIISNIMSIKGGSVNSPITVRSSLSMIDSSVNAIVTQYGSYGLIKTVVSRNTFGETAYHLLAPDTQGTIVEGYWTNNYSNNKNNNFVEIINRGNLVQADASHNYLYEGNCGPNVLQREVESQIFNTGTSRRFVNEALKDNLQYVPVFGLYSHGLVFSSNFKFINGVYVRDLPLSVRFFSLGLKKILVKLKFNFIIPGMDKESDATMTNAYFEGFSAPIWADGTVNLNMFNGKMIGNPVSCNKAIVFDGSMAANSGTWSYEVKEYQDYL